MAAVLAKSEGKAFEKFGKTMSYPIEDYTPPYSQSKHDLKTTYCWDGLLSRSDILAAPVKAFRHVRFFAFYYDSNPSFSRGQFTFLGPHERLLAKHNRWHEGRSGKPR